MEIYMLIIFWLTVIIGFYVKSVMKKMDFFIDCLYMKLCF